MMFGMKKVRTPLKIKTAPDRMNMAEQLLSSRKPAMLPPINDAENKFFIELKLFSELKDSPSRPNINDKLIASDLRFVGKRSYVTVLSSVLFTPTNDKLV